jgi:hypothetical protein
MSKADSSPSTAVPASKSRRAVILGAGGIVAAGAVTGLPAFAAAAGAQFSPEFLHYQTCNAAWLACFVEPYEEDEAWEALSNERDDTRWEAINVLLGRTPRSWQDVVELAHLNRMELWEDDLSGTHSAHGDIEPALMKAIFAVAKGGANA